MKIKIYIQSSNNFYELKIVFKF